MYGGLDTGPANEVWCVVGVVCVGVVCVGVYGCMCGVCGCVWVHVCTYVHVFALTGSSNT